MPNPCLQTNHSDFRGYPTVTPFTAWRTTSADPCSVAPSTFVEVQLVYNSTDEKYYNYPDFTLANGKYFTNPDGNGKYKNIVNGVEDTGLLAVNNTCTRLPNNEAPLSYFRYELKGEPVSFDHYNNYMIIAFSNLNVVVRCRTDQGDNPTAKIVAGSLHRIDDGLSVNSYLDFPHLVKFNSSNGKFVVYSDGVHKSFKVFDINGVLQYKHNDSDLATGNLNYAPAEPNEPAFVPRNWSGLIGRLTYRATGSSEAQINTDTNNLWHVTSLDFVTVPNANIETVFVGTWSFNNDTGNNSHMVSALTFFSDGLVFGTPTIYQELYHFNDYGNQGNELIPSFCVSKMVGLTSTTARVELTLILPRGVGSFSNYTHIEYSHTASATALAGTLPGYYNHSTRNVGNFTQYLYRDSIFEGNLRAEVRRNSSGQLIVLTQCYWWSKWRYRKEVALQWYATEKVLAAAYLIRSLTGEWKNNPATNIWNWGSHSSGNFSLMGIVGIVVTIGAMIWVNIALDPKKTARYSVLKIIPGPGTGTTAYTRFGGHNVGYYYSNQFYGWFNEFKTDGPQAFSVQNGSTINNDTAFVFNRKGLITDYVKNTIKYLDW